MSSWRNGPVVATMYSHHLLYNGIQWCDIFHSISVKMSTKNPLNYITYCLHCPQYFQKSFSCWFTNNSTSFFLELYTSWCNSYSPHQMPKAILFFYWVLRCLIINTLRPSTMMMTSLPWGELIAWTLWDLLLQNNILLKHQSFMELPFLHYLPSTMKLYMLKSWYHGQTKHIPTTSCSK